MQKRNKQSKDRSVFKAVNIYLVEAECRTPLHVGSADGKNGEILIHPVTEKPFIQASGIAGAFREYAQRKNLNPEKWFGSSNGDATGTDSRSKIIFTDGEFAEKHMSMELRTRVRIDAETGTTKTEGKSGQLLKTEYISAGSHVFFKIYEYLDDIKENAVIPQCLKALDAGNILIGGQVSNGCGELKLIKAERISCNMCTPEGRKAWADPDNAAKQNIIKDICKIKTNDESFYELRMQVVFDEAVLVKGDQVSQEKLEETMGIRFKEDDRLPDKMQLIDGRGKFVIPGSSIKGVFRNHIENILDYLDRKNHTKLSDELIEEVFENRSHLYFYDAYIGGGMNLQVRTHIDKLTGSVMDKALFKEAVNGGKNAKSEIVIRLQKDGMENEQIQKITALLFMTMRDCAVGIVNFGSGYSLGRGFMTVKNIVLSDNGKVLADINVEKGTGADSKFIKDCLGSLVQGRLS